MVSLTLQSSVRHLSQTRAVPQPVGHEENCGHCDLLCSSVQSLPCFPSAVSLGPVISEMKEKTMYNINKLQVGLRYQGTEVSF